MPKLTIPDVLARVAKLDSRTYCVNARSVVEALRGLCAQHPQLEQHFF